MSPALIPLFLSLVGVAIGVLAGMIGIGGGLLTIPALLYLYPALWPDSPEFTMKALTGIAVLLSMTTSMTSIQVHHRRANLNWSLIFFMGFGSLVGGYLGGMTSYYYDEATLKIFYAILLSVMLAMQLREEWQRRNHKLPLSEEGLPEAWVFKPRYPVPVFLLSMAIGYSSGLMGIGGAVFIMPFMHYGLKAPLRLAIGCTTGVVLLTCVASLVGKLQQGLVPFPAALLVSGGAMAGAYLGVKIGFKTPEWVLKALFMVIVGATLLRVLIELSGFEF